MSTFDMMFRERATVERNTSTKDSLGHPGAPGWTVTYESLRCRIWTKDKMFVTDDRKVAEVEHLHMAVKKDADVRSGDRIRIVKDRRGQTVMDGPFLVLTETTKSAALGTDHKIFKIRRAH